MIICGKIDQNNDIRLKASLAVTKRESSMMVTGKQRNGTMGNFEQIHRQGAKSSRKKQKAEK